MNPIEQLKAEKNGLDVWDDILRWAREGWEAIPERERDRLKWYGIFYRKRTPGYFMIRVRVPGGILRHGHFQAVQLRELAAVTRDYGRDILDLTTRQQVQLRWIRIEHVPEILDRLRRVGLTTLQTGIDNVRNVTGCPVGGLDQDEVLDARPLIRELTDLIVGNRAYANLPRKFNVTIIGCREDCTHAEINDIGLVPAARVAGGRQQVGFNVWVGGALGSWGSQRAWPLDAFVLPGQAVELCRHILEIYIEHGPRESRNKSRLKFLIDDWGIARLRAEVAARCPFPLAPAGEDLTRRQGPRDHVGIHPQKQPGHFYVGLLVPAGRLKLHQAFELARLAEAYGTGELRLTTGQNVIIPNVPEDRLAALLEEPLLQELTPFPPPFERGLVACTGKSFCPFALIETKDRAREVAAYLDSRFGPGELDALGEPIRIHVSGCPNACGQPHLGHIGLIGKQVKVNGQIEEAADVYLGGEMGLWGAFAQRVQQGVPFRELGPLLEGIVRAFLAERTPGETFREWCARTGRVQGPASTCAPILDD